MYLRENHGLELIGAAAGGRFIGGAPVLPGAARMPVAATPRRIPDLGQRIGSGEWWLGVVACTALLGATWLLSPTMRAMPGAVAAPLTGEAWEEARTQSIAPLSLGATTGRRMAATALVRHLAKTPERPSVDTAVTLGDGDTMVEALQRAGVGVGEAGRVADLVASAVPLSSLKPGTTLALTLGRRPSPVQPRPVDKLTLRAAFDLNLSVARQGGALSVERHPIALDRTPLHVRGAVGQGLYRSLRAANVPARIAETYIRAIADHVAMRDIAADDTYDLVIDQVRAATGEVEVGALQYAGLQRGGRDVQLVRWSGDADADDDRATFWDANQPRSVTRPGTFAMPVAGHVTSTFGMRMHPLLGFMRLHKGMDIGARYGAPIMAATDGVVAMAGRAGGYGNFVKLAHAGGLATGYGHMSRVAVRAGQRVRRGQVIGYVGSTGLSTGPHLHWEVWKNGTAVNPRTLSFSTTVTVPAATMRAVKAKLARLLAVPARG